MSKHLTLTASDVEKKKKTQTELFFFLLLFTKYQHKYLRRGCVILLCVDMRVCVCETEEQAEKTTGTNAPPLCNEHTVAFTGGETSHTTRTAKRRDTLYSEIKRTLHKKEPKMMR